MKKTAYSVKNTHSLKENLSFLQLFVIISLLMFIVLTAIVCTPVAYAGNPLYMKTDGTPLVWDTSKTIKYKVDPKGLGKLSYDQSVALVNLAISVWESVAGTGIQFEYLGPLDESITINNWEKLAGNFIYHDSASSSADKVSESQSEGYLVIGFDEVGAILEAKGSSGASGAQSITGIQGTYENPKFISSAHVFLNGNYYDGDDDISDLSLTDLLSVLVHELGHVLGLDHNLSHYPLYTDIMNGDLDPSYARYLPTMFPRFIRTTGHYLLSLNPDDIATLKWLYSDDDSYFLITGTLTDSNGQPQDKINVNSRNINASLCEVYSQATSVTCSERNTLADSSGDAYFTGKYCENDSALGDFVIPILDVAQHTIDIHEIPENFSTSIARFDGTLNELTHVAEFYNVNDSEVDDPYTYTTFSIFEDKDYLDITLSQPTSGEDLDYIDYSYFEKNTFFETSDPNQTYCPETSEYDEDTILHIINTTVIAPSIAVQNEAQNASGCSLKRELVSQRQPQSLPLFFLLLFSLLILRAKTIKNHFI
ncbi:MAG: matrixin family metalloprotease [bacterium]